MSHFARRPRFKSVKTALCLLGLGVAATLGWSGLRARRLLANSRQIAGQSAGFSRDYWVGSGPEMLYLAMGDSTAAGWGAGDLASSYPHRIASALAARHFRVHVVNVAVGGATVASVRRDQSAALRRAQPDLITLSVGANDATHRTSDADFAREMRALLAGFGASRARLILIANVPDMRLAPALPLPISKACGRRARALNQVLNRVLAAPPRNSKIRIVDLFGRGKLDYGRDPGLYAADLFHPSARGYGVWAALWIEALGAAFGSGAGQGR